MIHHNGPIAGIATWGNWIATAGYDNQLILWNALERTSVAIGNHEFDSSSGRGIGYLFRITANNEWL
jgi:hypothetical protein